MKQFLRGVVLTVFGLLALLAIGIVLFWAPDVPVDSLKVRWAKAPSQFINVQGMQVHLRDEGPRDDPLPIVLLHGTSASLHTWDGWTGELRNKRRIIRFDLPGFGLTGPNPKGSYDVMQDYVPFVLAVLDELKVQRFVIAGNSLGGQIAWSVAVIAPTRVDKLILVDAGGFPLDATSIPIGFQLARMPAIASVMLRVLPRRVIESTVRNVYGKPERVTPELVDLYYDITLREGNRAALGARFKTMKPADITKLSMLKMPTLILWGGQDRLIAPANGERFERAITGSKRIVFPELGHVPHEEDPAQTIKPVRDFLGL